MGMVLRRPAALRRDARAGFSLIETLIAGAILLIIALGLIPLFTQSMANNSLGNDYAQASTLSKGELESLQKLPFENLDVTVANGKKETQRLGYMEQPALGQAIDPGQWEFVDPGHSRWTRTTVIRQYNVRALNEDDWRLEEDELKFGGDPILQPGELLDENANTVQIKSIEVQLDSPKRQSILGGINRMTFVLLKPF
ncbi:MAG TPA: prepilin-type N-terminal cleavage/methylation domain-containing protein [Thermoanaerobaculia bacterium]|nr:prepilin-type N-terminal cleavage/methylation domain-containing protein [Thermoanaerobaculia bacterium]